MTSPAIASSVQPPQISSSPKLSTPNSVTNNPLYYDISSPQNLAAVSTLLNAANLKDSRWLTLEVCRQYQRSVCTREENECKFAHPPPHVDIQYGRVTCCYDSIKGKCQRKDPPCKYLHPPQHLKEQLVQNGRKNLIVKSIQLHLLQQQLLTPGNSTINNGFQNTSPLSLFTNASSLLEAPALKPLDITTSNPPNDLLIPSPNSITLQGQDQILNAINEMPCNNSRSVSMLLRAGSVVESRKRSASYLLNSTPPAQMGSSAPFIAHPISNLAVAFNPLESNFLNMTVNPFNYLNAFPTSITGNTILTPGGILNSNGGSSIPNQQNEFLSQYLTTSSGPVRTQIRNGEGATQNYQPLPPKRQALPRERTSDSKKLDSSDVIPPNSTGFSTNQISLMPQGPIWINHSNPMDFNLLAAINLVPTDSIYRTPCSYPFDWNISNFR